jgi:hypothetical protein
MDDAIEKVCRLIYDSATEMSFVQRVDQAIAAANECVRDMQAQHDARLDERQLRMVVHLVAWAMVRQSNHESRRIMEDLNAEDFDQPQVEDDR